MCPKMCRFVLNLSMSNLTTCSLLTPLSLLDQTLADLLSSPGDTEVQQTAVHNTTVQ